MNIFEIFGTIAINNEQANKALTDTGKQANGLSNTMEAAFSKMQGAARKIGTAIATAFAVDKIKDFGQSCAETFASVAAEESAFAQIMGDYSERATEKMKYVADQTGVVSTRLTPYMTSMTAKFKGLGYGVEEATNLASEGLVIASDAAAFWDKSLDESMSHLNSFINGSYEGGEAIGLFANDTQMAAYAVKKGIVSETKAWSQLDEARKQSTRLQYAKEMMASSGATGQAALEAENFANVQANLTEQFRQFQAVIGEPIMNNIMLPAMRRLSQMMPGITDKTKSFIESFTSGLNKAATYFSSDFDPAAMVNAFGGMVSNAIKAIPGKLAQFGQTIASTWTGSVWPSVQQYFQANLGIELPDWETLKTDIQNNWETKVWANVQGIFKKRFALDLPDWEAFKTDIQNGWESKVWINIKDNFEKQFGITMPDWANIEAEIKNGWETHVSPNVKDFFKVLVGLEPSSTDSTGTEWGTRLKTWFDGIMASRMDMFNITVGLLMHDVDESGQRWSIAIADWFHAMAGEVSEQLQITFGVIMPTPEETAKIQQNMTTWLHGSDGKSGIVGLIANAIAFPFDLALQECVNIWEDFQTWLASISETGKISTETGGETEWARGAKYDYRLWGYGQEELGLLQKWIDAVNEFKKLDLSATEEEVLSAEAAKEAARQAIQEAMGAEGAEQLISDYMSWLSGQVESETEEYYKDIPVSLAENAAADLQSDLNGLNLEATVTMVPDYSQMGSASGDRVAPPPTVTSHARGLDFVPRDGYLARLHYGEAVLNRTTADMLRSGGGMGDTSRLEAAINNLGTMLQQVIHNTAAGHQVVLDTGVLAGQMAPALDAQLGTISTRRGRRN